MAKFVKLFSAGDFTEFIKMQVLLDRAQIPYTTRNEIAIQAIGYPALGPVEFLVPEDLYEVSQELIEKALAVSLEDVPTFCPACHTATIPSKPDCPECGLFLG